jgi:exopolysaccharide production protein ExoQ
MFGLIMCLAGHSWGAGLLVAAWGLVAAARAQLCLNMLLRSPGIWLVPAVTAASVIWSDAPMVTLRAAIELALTVGAASLAAGFLLPRSFISAMSLSLFTAAILSVAFGRYGVDGDTGEFVFLGIFASKNTMAAFMSFLAIFAAAVLMDRGQPTLARLQSALSFIVSIPLLLRAHSAGALLTTAGSLVVLALTILYARLRPYDRLMVLGGCAALLVPIAVVVLLLALNGTLGDEWSNFLIGILGKDASMTGRTLLWQIAQGEIAKRPFLGTGYYAFWLQGNLLAESIWRHFQIMTRGGFSFHDTYFEFAVELGLIGLVALVITLAVGIERTVRLALADQTWATAALVSVVFCLVTRTIGEVDIPYPFSTGTFLFYAAAAYGADYAMVVWRGRRSAVDAAHGVAPVGARVAASSWPTLTTDRPYAEP